MSNTPFLNTKTFSNVCRLCLRTGNLFMIDEVYWESSQLKKVLSQWIFFDKMGERKLPQRVCKSCIKWVYNTDYFLKQIQKNQEILEYSLSYNFPKTEKEDHLEKKAKQEKLVILEMEFKESNEDVVINYYCDTDKSSVLNETNEENNCDENDVSSCSTSSLLQADPENDKDDLKFKDKTNEYIIVIAPGENIASTSDFKFNNEDVMEARNQEIKIESQLHLECFNYFCGACELGFKTDAELLIHKKLIKSHIYGGCIFICHPCKLKTKNRQKFEVHMYGHQNIKPHQCSTCGKTFRAIGDLQRHNNNIHLNIKKPKCQFCYRIFKDNESRAEHEKTHQDIKYICSICGESFIVWYHWKNHEKSHTKKLTERKRIYSSTKAIKSSCDICEEIFASKTQMVAHRIQVHNQSHFTCQTCGQNLKTLENFELHMKTHNGLRENYQCTYCEKSFIDVKWYRSHVKMHTNEPKYKCPYCEKPCINKRAYTNHLRLHTGEKPQKCHLCPKVFASKENLKYHLKTHSGPPTFECSLCPRAFYMNYILQRHIKKKHTSPITSPSLSKKSEIKYESESSDSSGPQMMKDCSLVWT